GAASRATPAVAASRLARLIFEKGEPAQQFTHPHPRRFDALLQLFVLLLRIRGAAPRLRVMPSRCRAARGRRVFLEIGFGFEGARAPGGELLQHVAENRLQLVEDRGINPLLSVVRQAQPPGPAGPPRGSCPPRSRAACGWD